MAVDPVRGAQFVQALDEFLRVCSTFGIRTGWLSNYKNAPGEQQAAIAVRSVGGYMTTPASRRLFDEVYEKVGAEGTLEALVLRYEDLFPGRSTDAALQKIRSVQ